MSSLSARPDAVSEYGRTKLALEQHFVRSGHTIIRPGTVLGSGGLFGKIASMLEHFPVLPLLDGGHASMTVIGIRDLCRAFEAVLQSQQATQYNFYYNDMPTLSDLLRLLATTMKRKVLFIHVPSALLVMPLSILKCISIRTPVDVDNLKGYVTSLVPYYTTNLSAVLPRPSTLQAALAENWSDRHL